MSAAPSRLASAASRGLEGLWRTHLLPRPVLDAEALEAAALKGRSPEAFGSAQEWRRPFRLLLESLRDEAALNPLGLSMAHGQIVQALRARIRAAALWNEHPEILERTIPAPIVILGPMRSGTTRLHRLLARDPRFAHTRLIESLRPLPERGRAWKVRASLAAMRRLNPMLTRIHPMAPEDAEEEFGLFSFSFGSAQFEAQWRVPRFTGWWESADTRWLYREFRALLQTIGWARGEAAEKVWLLKAPQFMQDLPVLLKAFPDARLICLDRPLDRVVASSASLVWHQMRIQSDEVDPEWIGREWLRKTLLRIECAAETRRARPAVPQLDLSYDEMDRDWRGEIARIYEFLGEELESETEARMAAYLEGARDHVGHRYSLEQFGLSREQVLRHG